MHTYTAEVEEKLRSLAPGTKQTAYADLQAYIGTTYAMLSMTVPQQRLILKQGYSFSSMSIAEQLHTWDTVWKETVLFEALSQAGLFAEKYAGKLPPATAWSILKTWVKKVDNWAHSDVLSGIYGKLLVHHTPVFSQLEKWNTSRNPWERRQSVVTLAMYYRRNMDIPFGKVAGMITSLLGDEDYFVQKGVGWVLREAGNRFPGEVKQYVTLHSLILTSTAFATATEKYNVDDKAKLKAARRLARQK